MVSHYYVVMTYCMVEICWLQSRDTISTSTTATNITCLLDAATLQTHILFIHYFYLSIVYIYSLPLSVYPSIYSDAMD